MTDLLPGPAELLAAPRNLENLIALMRYRGWPEDAARRAVCCWLKRGEIRLNGSLWVERAR